MNDILKRLQNERKSYLKMVEFCTDNLILNNYIVQELSNDGYYFGVYCGDKEVDEEIFQYFIINGLSAERFAKFTNELVIYNEKLDLYVLCVTHYGTSWDYVNANWKDEI